MSKIIRLTESELVQTIKKIILENSDRLEFYDNEDLTDIYFTLFKEWISKNVDERYRKYPISYLLKKFSRQFEIDTSGSSDETPNTYTGFSPYKVKRYLKKLIDKGDFTLPTMQSDHKFTEKYAKYIPIVLEAIDIPDFVDLHFEEKEPYVVFVTPIVNFEKMMKSDSKKRFNEQTFNSEFKKYFENFLGVDFGNPKYGEVFLRVNDVRYDGFDEWVKKVFEKKIKKSIKELPFGKDISRIKMVLNRGDVSITIYRKTWSVPSNQFREQIMKLIQDLGYNPSKFSISFN